MDAYLGVDISSGRWAGYLLGDRQDAAVVADTIEELVAAAATVGRPNAIAIDVPLDPPTSGVRACDAAARAVLGGRSATLFTAPALPALEVARRHGFGIGGYKEAAEANRAAQGVGLSRQAYGLAAKILDVHDWLARGGAAGIPVIECHPELSFAHLVNPRQPVAVPFRKTSWEGLRRRMKMLHGAGIDVQYVRDETGQIGADDLLDAAAAAWTARRYAAGNAVRLPAEGSPAIWA
jgi:predicted RNase H-like nuclease